MSLKGVWLLPTLNRVSLVKEFIDSFKEAEGTTPGLLLVDKADYALNEEAYQSLILPPGWGIMKTDAVSMGDKVREVWDFYKDLDWVGILNDDHRPRTKRFDQCILAQLKPHGIIGTNDGPTPDKPWMAPGRLAGGIVFGGDVIRSLAYFFPPGIKHLYSDNAWELLGSRAQCVQILMDVCVEHDHAYKNQKEDDTFKKVNSKESWESDKLAFDTWVNTQASKDVDKLIAIQPKEGLMIATPSHDGQTALIYTTGLSESFVALSQNRVFFQLATVVGSSLLAHARNSLVDMFLKSKCQKLLFIDSDQGFNPSHLFALFQSNKRIIGGITPHKRFPINFNFEPLEEHNHYFKEQTNKGMEEMAAFVQKEADPKGEIEVNRVGTGFLMIDRSVFELMKPHVETYEPFDNDPTVTHYEFFKMGTVKESTSKRYRGEDWFFTELAKELHIPIYINAHVVLKHQGVFQWP